MIDTATAAILAAAVLVFVGIPVAAVALMRAARAKRVRESPGFDVLTPSDRGNDRP